VGFDHVSRAIINANHGVMRPAVKLGKADGIADCGWPAVPEATASISPQRASWSLSDLIQSLCALMLSEALEEAIWLPLRSLVAISSKGE
jgi:hypothetical protein